MASTGMDDGGGVDGGGVDGDGGGSGSGSDILGLDGNCKRIRTMFPTGVCCGEAKMNTTATEQRQSSHLHFCYGSLVTCNNVNT